MTDNDEQKLLDMLTDTRRQREAFSMVVSQYSEKLYWQIRRMVLSHDDANDVLQNTLIKAWNNFSSFQKKSKFSTWLYRIAVNESLDFLRHQKLMQQVRTEEEPSVATQLMADSYFDGDETEALLQEAIASLPDVQRMVFSLRYYDKMKYSEMSQLLDTSEGALKASYHLAVKKIRDFFEQRD